MMKHINRNGNDEQYYIDNKSKTYLDRRVVGSFMTITSVISPNLLK